MPGKRALSAADLAPLKAADSPASKKGRKSKKTASPVLSLDEIENQWRYQSGFILLREWSMMEVVNTDNKETSKRTTIFDKDGQVMVDFGTKAHTHSTFCHHYPLKSSLLMKPDNFSDAPNVFSSVDGLLIRLLPVANTKNGRMDDRYRKKNATAAYIKEMDPSVSSSSSSSIDSRKYMIIFNLGDDPECGAFHRVLTPSKIQVWMPEGILKSGTISIATDFCGKEVFSDSVDYGPRFFTDEEQPSLAFDFGVSDISLPQTARMTDANILGGAGSIEEEDRPQLDLRSIIENVDREWGVMR